MAFKTADEAYELFKKTLEKIEKDEALYKSLAAANITVGVKVPNIDGSITIICKDGKLQFEFGPSSQAVDGTITLNDDNLVRFWQGKLDPMVGMAKGELKADGNFAALTKLIPLIKPIYPLFTEVLKESGREDLVQ